MTATYTLRQDELEVLRAACGTADLIDQLQDAMKDQPAMVPGSKGQLVAHPLLQEVRQQRLTFSQLVRGLKLPDENSGAAVNPHRAGGQSRWMQAYGKSI
ncbi:hypothetical protein C5C37_12370 [Rathayibacter sp. AY1F9]|nr:hypothetical protein C5C37_12370 [Rathayibacter sp. AY1F9]